MVFYSITGNLTDQEDEKPNGHVEPDSTVDVVVESGEEKREEWDNYFDFILSCIGYAVGLGNVWRFPYLCYENGGGAFLLPYIIMLLACGLPLFFMELSFGQFASKGTVSVWNISPLFRGVGIGMLIPSALVAIYYNVIIAWTVYYAFKSFSFPNLPWISCNNTWNTDKCYDDFLNTTRTIGLNRTEYVRATEEFWIYNVHGLTDSFGDFGGMNWHLLGCLAASWTVVYLCLIKGVKSAGKVVYFTAVFPYVVLVILFFRAVTLPGAGDGVAFYIIPKFADILSIRPWRAAATQIFYSLGISFGGLMTFASYNKFHNNCYRDAIIVAFTNCGTSIFAGFVIFSTIGFMAHSSGLKVEEVVASGPGLAFIAYPEALAKLPGAQFWSFIFFVMLFTLGLDSEFATIETVVTAIVDELPPHRKWWKPYITLTSCIIGFLSGILIVTKNGLYTFTLINDYSAGFSLMVIAATYSLVISWVYGLDRFCKDIECMIGFKPGLYWRICWSVVIPVLLAVIILLSFVFYTRGRYGDYIFPATAEVFGWIMTLASFLAIPGYMVYALIYLADHDTILERVKFLMKPNREWGPLLNVNRKEAGYPEIVSSVDNRASEKKLPDEVNYNKGYDHVDFRNGDTARDQRVRLDSRDSGSTRASSVFMTIDQERERRQRQRHASDGRRTSASSRHMSDGGEDGRGRIMSHDGRSTGRSSATVDMPDLMVERRRQRYRHMSEDLTPPPSPTFTNVTDKSYI